MDNRRDILKSEITEFQQRLGIKVITTRNLKSIEDCRKAFVKIAEYYASISQGKLVNPGLDTEVDILRKKVKVLQEEKAELEKTNQAYSNNIKTLQNTTKNFSPTYNERLKVNAFKTDFDTTTKIIPLLWKLRDETSSLFSELELLLEINSNDENIKMSKGLKKVGKDLIEIGKKIIKYSEKTIIIDLEE